MNKRSAAIFAVSGFALAAVVSVAPARASTVTDLISFSAMGTYATDGDPTHGYQGTATANGSFKITFDPTQLYLTQSITGIITNLTYSITDPFFGGLLPLNTITQFAFDGSGTLKLYSDATAGTGIVGTPDITIGINGWAYGTASSVWYSQDQYGHTLTTSGTAIITELGPEQLASETPLPATLPLFATGLGALGLIGRRRKRKQAV